MIIRGVWMGRGGWWEARKTKNDKIKFATCREQEQEEKIYSTRIVTLFTYNSASHIRLLCRVVVIYCFYSHFYFISPLTLTLPPPPPSLTPSFLHLI
jgi:hypothetical protein